MLLSSNSVLAQKSTFSVSISDGKVIDFFKEIESQSDYRFTYNARDLSKELPKISVLVKEVSIDELLLKMEKEYDLKFLILGSNISVAIEKRDDPQNVTVSGYIIDQSSGDILIGATIFCTTLLIGTTSDLAGFYSLTLPADKHSVTIQYIGYETQVIEIDLYSNQHKTIRLHPKSNNLNEVVVRKNERISAFDNFNLSSNKLNIQDIRKYPSIFAEKDVLLSIDFMPGISINPENINGISIRGSSEGENLTTIDKIPVYNISHSISNISIFNPDIINYLTINKGGVPLQFGERAASSIQVVTRKGNKNKIELNGGISNISTRFCIEGPMFKSKMSFLLSARRGGKGIFQSAFNYLSDAKIYYYDLNSKLNYQVNTKNELTFSTYWGKDFSSFDIDGNQYALSQWNTNTYSLDWNRIVNGKFTYNLTGFLSSYRYLFSQDSLNLGVYVDDIGVRNDFNLYLNPSSIYRFGMVIINHMFDNPLVYEKPNQAIDTKYKFYLSLESSVYFINERKLSDRIKIKAGARFSAFNQFDHGDFYDTYSPYEDSGISVLDTTQFDLSNHYSVSPSVQFNYQLSTTSSIKVSYIRSSQYLHQLSSINTEGLIYKILVPSNNGIQPLYVDQISAGYMKTSSNSVYELAIESYYKIMKNTIEYKDSVITINSKYPIRNYVQQGRGIAYGLEFLLRKKNGNLQGIVSYSLSRSTKQIDGINNGERFFSTQHQPHDFAININYQFNESFNLTANFIYQSGRRYTSLEEGPDPVYERNNCILADYHRADLGIRYERKKKRKFKSTWEFTIFNLYNRQNAYFMYKKDKSQNNETDYNFYSLYGITPTISWSFKL
ncbi:MAG: TonB-dependent receptor [Bacteroidales bacterium]|nr:TonB-dependent receptor [Bacteroidales bacterium]